MPVMERNQYTSHRTINIEHKNRNNGNNSSNDNNVVVIQNGYNSNNNNYGGNSRPPCSTSPSILDSPTLARVERAHRRNESEEQRSSLFHNTLSSYCPSLISVDPGREMHAIKKGLLWQQRERLFARWKERYFILTRDYLHCFKRSSGSEKISNMGQFIFKVKLVDVEKVEWINKKSYSTIALALQDRDYRILLRTNEGLEDWFELLDECMMTSKERRKALQHKFGNSSLAWSVSADPGCEKLSKPSNLDTWLLSRTNPASIVLEQSNLSDSVPDLEQQSQQRYRDEHLWRRKSPISYQQRLSLLTDIDINNCDSSTGTPSIQSSSRGTPYHVNNDVFFATPEEKCYSSSMCSNRSILSPLGSFRNTSLFTPPRTANQDRIHDGTGNGSNIASPSPLLIKYRDRSQSDAINCKIRSSSSSSANRNNNNSSSSSNRRSYVSQQATHV